MARSVTTPAGSTEIRSCPHDRYTGYEDKERIAETCDRCGKTIRRVVK